VEGFRAIPGTGAEGWVDGQSVYVGRSSQGHVELRVEGLRVATFAMADQLRPGTAAAVDSLRKAGLDVWLMSGDRAEVAQAVAREVGIEPDRVLAGVMPGEKAETITKLRAQNKRVAMVGDGVNDAPALAAANVGIAIGTGTDVAIESAGMILMKSDPAQVALALGLARRTLRVIHQNLFWAFGYNTLAIPVAAGLLYPWTGWTISPMLASAAMAMSSISVVLNSLRLRQA
jgi:P-type E1-E2 ATPase